MPLHHARRVQIGLSCLPYGWRRVAVKQIADLRRLVFIGYSLPSADFEFRQLLSRMVHKDTKIEAFLWGEAATYKDEKKAV
jgi:hypothetical protein